MDGGIKSITAFGLGDKVKSVRSHVLSYITLWERCCAVSGQVLLPVSSNNLSILVLIFYFQCLVIDGDRAYFSTVRVP